MGLGPTPRGETNGQSHANTARSEQAARAFKAALGADGLPPECRGEVEARAEMARQAAIAANPACAQS